MARSTTTARPDSLVGNHRTASLLCGLLFIGTFLFSIPSALFLYTPILENTDWVLGNGSESRIAWGMFLEIALVVCNAGTAIVLFPVMKRYTETLALSYVGSRVFESAMIAIGIVSLLGVFFLRQDFIDTPGADAGSYVSAAQALIAVHDATFLIGPAFCAAIGNGLILGYMMFKTNLIPRKLSVIGLIGGTFAMLTATLVLFGVYEQVSVWSFLLTFPEMVWEMSFGIWMVAKGFSPAAIAKADETSEAPLVALPALA